jgi:hypothetical protein
MRSSDSVKHDVDEGQIKPRLGVFGFDFVVPDQAMIFHEPAKSTLDDPAFGQDNKIPDFVATDDLNLERTGAPMNREPLGKIVSDGVSGIHEEVA